jgi:hypothetical protein
MISQRQKHTKQRRFYVPGLISLFLFFPLALFQLKQYGAFEKSYALEVNWYSPELVDLQFPPARQFQVISLNGNKRDDDIKLNFAQIAIQEMLAMNDTVNGVRVHFTDTARYESFIRVLDICLQEDGLSYAPYKNDVWIFNQNPITVLDGCIAFSHPFCGTFAGSIENGRVPFPFRYHYDTRFWPILLMLVALCTLSFTKGLR